MGIRTRVAKINKEYADKLRNARFEYLHSVLGMNTYTTIPQSVDLYEVGKATITGVISEPFYTQIEMEPDSNVLILNEEQFISYLLRLGKDTETMYKYLLSAIETGAVHQAIQFFHTRVEYWGENLKTTLALDDSPDGEITHSWMVEAAIFNLVHILKTFDWDNDYCLIITS